MTTSQNGYPASSDRAAIGVRTFAVPGHPTVLLPIRADIAPLLLEMARWWFAVIEPPEVPGCWGWSYRPIRGATQLSNHASGTAIDLNAPSHPLGVRGTVPASKRAAIITKAHSLGCRWGGEYSGRVDEMHIEINVPLATALDLVRRLQNAPDGAPKETDMQPTDKATDPGPGMWGHLWMNAQQNAAATRQMVTDMQADLAEIKVALAQLKGGSK